MHAFLDGTTSWLAGLPDWQAVAVLVGGSIVAAAVIHVAGNVLVRRLTARIPGEAYVTAEKPETGPKRN